MGCNAFFGNFCDCDVSCWDNIISSLLRWKFVLRPSAKTQGSNERLHGEVVATGLTKCVTSVTVENERSKDQGVPSFYDIKTNL